MIQATTPELSVLIICSDPCMTVAGLLSDLSAQTVKANRFEVLLIQCAPPSPVTLNPSSYPFCVQVILQHGETPATARRLAMKHVHAPLVLLLHEDLRAPATLLEDHLNAHAKCETPTAVTGVLDWCQPSEKTLFHAALDSMGWSSGAGEWQREFSHRSQPVGTHGRLLKHIFRTDIRCQQAMVTPERFLLDAQRAEPQALPAPDAMRLELDLLQKNRGRISQILTGVAEHSVAITPSHHRDIAYAIRSWWRLGYLEAQMDEVTSQSQWEASHISSRLRAGIKRFRWPEAVGGKISYLLLPLLLAASLNRISFSVFGGLVALLTVMGLFGYLVNDWCDCATDRSVGKANAFFSASPMTTGIIIGLMPLALFGLGFLCEFSSMSWFLLGFQTLASVAYSAPPLRLKNRGVSGLVCVLLAQYLLPMILMLAAVGETHFLVCGLLTGFITLNGFLLETGHQVWDVRNDVATRLNTAIRVWGPHRAAVWYHKGIPFLGAGIVLLPVGLTLTLWVKDSTTALILSALPMVVIAVLAGVAARKTYRSATGPIDPYYQSRGDGMDRLYTYFPSAALPMYWLIVVIPFATQDWRFVALAPFWVFFALPDHTFRFHTTEWRYLLFPPEWVGYRWRRA